MHKDIALFLLDHPPLDEIGGSITDIIEMYRVGTITKRKALRQLVTTFAPVLQKYANEQTAISELELDIC